MDYQRLGPFVIVDQVNDAAFRLDLPGRVIPPPPPIELVDGPEFEVEAILDSKIVRNKLYYLVDWLGYSPTISLHFEHFWAACFIVLGFGNEPIVVELKVVEMLTFIRRGVLQLAIRSFTSFSRCYAT